MILDNDTGDGGFDVIYLNGFEELAKDKKTNPLSFFALSAPLW